MIDGLAGAREEVLPSIFWTSLNKKNISQLESGPGYENFKQTVACNYYTWVISPRKDPQTYALMEILPKIEGLACVIRALCSKRHKYFGRWRNSFFYNLLTFLLWAHVRRLDQRGDLAKLHEPREGNPPPVYRGSRLISQDLAQSYLEYHAIASRADLSRAGTIMELGSGYGRTAFVFLTLMPAVRYFIVDIPPALYISERYLSSQFAGRKVFRYRPFSNYAQVKDEIERAELIFLLPNQLELLPDKTCDLFINISSFHEMKPKAIAYYFQEIGRLTTRYFYFKQWKTWTNPEDHIVISEGDYPVGKEWRRIFQQQCAVQTQFFEALYQL
ncbi:MAG: putative sugar O-methyltransferase [Tepidisphaeraceae bacterium]